MLQRLCANEMDVPVNRMVYTAMLNERGGFESDLTITRLASDSFSTDYTLHESNEPRNST